MIKILFKLLDQKNKDMSTHRAHTLLYEDLCM